jgi:hypothetical protein
MKFYESTFEEYLTSVDQYNIHMELESGVNKTPVENMIVYGPSGTGKYTQVLKMIRPHSPSELKYEKKIIYQVDKQEFIYHISDIHYEIDMSLLGCNSKNTWYEIFSQIVDIISMKKDRCGIVVCKNFHMINNELLEIFYSYIQQYNYAVICIKYILITEHLSFIPNKIIDVCHIVNIARPSSAKYDKLLSMYELKNDSRINRLDIKNAYTESSDNKGSQVEIGSYRIMENINIENVLNIKELRSFPMIKSSDQVPKDIFNTICDNIIEEMENPGNINYSRFRDIIYDILIYNLDAGECLWYIICHFIMNGNLSSQNITNILNKTYSYFKYYNNNYRPIYHLERILFYIIIQTHGNNEGIKKDFECEGGGLGGCDKTEISRTSSYVASR